MKFTLPFPDGKLNPNRIVYFRVRAVIKSTYKATCYRIIKSACLGRRLETTGRIPVTIIFHAPDKRGRDLDNLLASMKSGLDGVAIALGVNDRQFRPVTIDFADSVFKGGKVEIEFFEVKNG